MKWIPLTIVLILIILAVIGSRHLPVNINNSGSINLEKTPVENAISTITRDE